LLNRIHQVLSALRAESDRKISRGLLMSISSVTAAPPPPPPLQPVEAKKPDVQPDQNDSRNAAPPAQAPLPPGQGTRVNVIA
jgi:hypothetical protein